MLACQHSTNIVNFIEEFRQNEHTYLVTKFVRGGDLLSYLGANNVDRLSEDDARHIFS